MIRYKTVIFLMTIYLAAFSSDADNIDLALLLNASGDITLDPSHAYYLANPYSIQRDTTITGNGSSIDIQNGPLSANGRDLRLYECVITAGAGWTALAIQNGSISEIQGGVCENPGSIAVHVSSSTLTLKGLSIRDSGTGINAAETSHVTLQDCIINNCDTSYYHVRGTCSWTDGSIAQAGGYAVNFTDSVDISMNGTHIAMSEPNSAAIQILKSSSGILDGVTIEGASYGVLVGSGDVTLRNSHLSSPFEFMSGAAPGIASQKGSRLTVHNVEFTGFENAVQVNSHEPRGSAEVYDCHFLDTEVSALSVNGAADIVFKNNYCKDTKQDAIYMRESYGVLERNTIIHSLNTGIAVIQCDEGVLIRDNYIQGCEHQGIAVSSGSDHVNLVQNSLNGNVICNVLVDNSSRATLLGNVLYGNPSFNVRLHGTPGSNAMFNLVCDSHSGIEVKDSASPAFLMNRIANTPEVGLLNYDSSQTTISFCHFYENGTLATNNYAIFNNTSAVLGGNYNNIGPADGRGLYNNAGLEIVFAQNYWGASNGPRVGETGSGAVLDWNASNGSSVIYEPYLSQAPLSSDHANDVSLVSGETSAWTAAFGTVSIEFTGKGGVPTITNQVCGALHCHATDPLSYSEDFPPEHYSGHLYAVWTSSWLCGFSDSITVTFVYDEGVTDNIQLYRRKESGEYQAVKSVQNAETRSLTYQPSDPFLAQGVYALGKKIVAPFRLILFY